MLAAGRHLTDSADTSHGVQYTKDTIGKECRDMETHGNKSTKKVACKSGQAQSSWD